MENQPIVEVDPDFSFGELEKTEYLPAPVNKPLAAHIVKINKTQQRNQFKTLPSGEANPNYDKLQDVYIFNFKLDESDAKGQVYTSWVSPAMSERSKLGKVAAAVWGEWQALSGKKAKDFIGKPLLITLKPSKNNPERLVVDTDKLFPPREDQVDIEDLSFALEDATE